MPSTASPCTAISKRTGKPCQGRSLPGSDYCLFHDPARAAQRAQARSAGGKARHGRKIAPASNGQQPIRLDSVNAVLAIVERALTDTLILENSNQRNRTLGTLALAALKAFEISELEQRLTALEQLVKENLPA